MRSKVDQQVLGLRPRRVGWLRTWASRCVHRKLIALRGGELTWMEPSGTRVYGQPTDLRATLTVQDPAFYTDVLLGGSLGAAEAYILGRWSTDDLTAVLRLFARNLDVSDRLDRGVTGILGSLTRWVHRLRRNTPAGSRANIHAHYDLGNDFFRLFLDDTMNYSCAIFESPQSSLEEASLAKMERACRKLELKPEDHVLEIGTGWGGLAIHAARHFGCRVTTATISEEQYREAGRRIQEAGMAGKVTVVMADYRKLAGRYDKLVSIEMIEAVGHRYLDTYFGACGRLLKEDGLMLLQGIVMADHRYERYRRSVDFIQRFVFPGGCLPSISAICRSVARSTRLRLIHLEDITPHYVLTLRHWRARFMENLAAVRRLGYTDGFMRLWQYYLSYCEAGFEERAVGDVQMLLAQPGNRSETVLAPVR